MIILTLIVSAALAALWQWIAVDGFVTAQRLHLAVESLAAARGSAWIPVLLVLGYVGGSLVVFPLSLFVLATGLIFGPWLGFGYALAGTMCAAASTYWAGRLIGREAIARHGGERMNRLAATLSRRGITASFLAAFLPLAPFTLTNMAAGALRIRLGHFLAGTFVGVAPGLLAITVVGSELPALLSAERAPEALVTIAAIAAVLAGLLLLGRRLAARGREKGVISRPGARQPQLSRARWSGSRRASS